MSDSSAKRHQAMEAGALAVTVKGAFEDILREKQLEIMQRMTSAYRGREPDRVFFGLAAELSAIDGLLAGLDSAQRRGEIAREKELGNGASTYENRVR